MDNVSQKFDAIGVVYELDSSGSRKDQLTIFENVFERWESDENRLANLTNH